MQLKACAGGGFWGRILGLSIHCRAAGCSWKMLSVGHGCIDQRVPGVSSGPRAAPSPSSPGKMARCHDNPRGWLKIASGCLFWGFLLLARRLLRCGCRGFPGIPPLRWWDLGQDQALGHQLGVLCLLLHQVCFIRAPVSPCVEGVGSCSLSPRDETRLLLGGKSSEDRDTQGPGSHWGFPLTRLGYRNKGGDRVGTKEGTKSTPGNWGQDKDAERNGTSPMEKSPEVAPCH